MASQSATGSLVFSSLKDSWQGACRPTRAITRLLSTDLHFHSRYRKQKSQKS